VAGKHKGDLVHFGPREERDIFESNNKKGIRGEKFGPRSLEGTKPGEGEAGRVLLKNGGRNQQLSSPSKFKRKLPSGEVT